MFKDDIDLVEQMVERYGLLLPFADLGGLHAKDLTVADYNITLETGKQRDRYLHLREDPFEHLAPGYSVLNPQYGDPPIEGLVKTHSDFFGTIVCLSVLEHVKDPFKVMNALRLLLKSRGLLILSTVFSFPLHDAPCDYWRFSPDCLTMLGTDCGLDVLETGWRLRIHGGMGIRELHTNRPQEIFSVYLAARRR